MVSGFGLTITALVQTLGSQAVAHGPFVASKVLQDGLWKISEGQNCNNFCNVCAKHQM